jgi:hypothetical protein
VAGLPLSILKPRPRTGLHTKPNADGRRRPGPDRIRQRGAAEAGHGARAFGEKCAATWQGSDGEHQRQTAQIYRHAAGMTDPGRTDNCRLYKMREI